MGLLMQWRQRDGILRLSERRKERRAKGARGGFLGDKGLLKVFQEEDKGKKGVEGKGGDPLVEWMEGDG